jgi:hypothetical protein
MAALEDFAAKGADLMLLVSRLALDTQGAFTSSSASITLSFAAAYAEAARNAFLVLSQDPSLMAADRARLMALANTFRKALGLIATRIPGPKGVAEVPSLAGFSQGMSLADYFGPAEATKLAVEPAAQAALEALRRDPIALAEQGTQAILLLVDAVVSGVAVAP